MNKTLQKAVMTRSRLRNKFLKNKTQSNETVYKNQRNYCVSLFRKEKKSFFGNLDTKNITGNKIFRKTVKPFLVNKISINRNKITLTQKDEIISHSKDVAEKFNTIFVNVVSNLGILINESLLVNSVETNDRIVNIIERYKTHPSIRLIKENATQFDNRFSFGQITYEDIHKEIRKLDSRRLLRILIYHQTSKKMLIFLQTFISITIKQYSIANSQQALEMPMFHQSTRKIQG